MLLQPTVHATCMTTCPMPLPISRKSLLCPMRDVCTTASSMNRGFIAPYIALVVDDFDFPLPRGVPFLLILLLLLLLLELEQESSEGPG